MCRLAVKKTPWSALAFWKENFTKCERRLRLNLASCGPGLGHSHHLSRSSGAQVQVVGDNISHK
jgi:hypothetical protein